jgi:NADP-dependent 3-hydroxy acid dehydrogenase YdfG
MAMCPTDSSTWVTSKEAKVASKYVVRHMMADGACRIVNISSTIALTGYNGLSVYAASKLRPAVSPVRRPAKSQSSTSP